MSSLRINSTGRSGADAQSLRLRTKGNPGSRGKLNLRTAAALNAVQTAMRHVGRDIWTERDVQTSRDYRWWRFTTQRVQMGKGRASRRPASGRRTHWYSAPSGR